MPQLKEIRGDQWFAINVAGAGVAATVAEFAGLIVPFNAKVTAAKWVPESSITAHAANYFTLTLRNRTTGAGSLLAASRAYSAVNSVAMAPESMTLSGTAANLNVAEGDHLSVEKLVAGDGLAMPAGVVMVALQVR
ncbi:MULTISPECIES: hypothetical protein [unclassified Crossiella]|uniref:hypothetical protein n=1 Tax=unclassified Crossiella TaxID=2620835 RepID=UPI001FFF2A41|nr:MULTISPECIES: hypothetical protein [unclassified Crossiella]MCK2242150.1 hypothetical protein [Crossiella sp. S99.2]MCK2256053.1 hypothetical protein [Crossiella sp. S99.1]